MLKGVAFRQEEVLGKKNSADFFVAQTHSAVAMDTDRTLHLVSK